jgi:starvation-inducible outer membrane lipoprotein
MKNMYKVLGIIIIVMMVLLAGCASQPEGYDQSSDPEGNLKINNQSGIEIGRAHV